MDNTIKYIDEYIKSGVYEMSLVEDDSGAKKVEPYVQKLRGFVTAISLGFSVKNFFRDSVEGIWKNSFSISHNDGRYDFEDLMASAKEMMFNVPASFDKVTLIEQICNYGRIANIDINRSAESLKSNKQGLFNFMSRGMYSCISAPDYMNRMTIFIAMMIHDGCYDALSIKNEEIKYDWKKDKRFSIYAKGDTSNPKYNEQRAAWLSLINGFRNEFPDMEFKESLTQELPFPYLRKQIDGFKNYADTIYGFYDTDVKSMAEKTFLGMVFMQFRTYLSGSLKKMTLKPGFYNEGKAHQGIDETTGKKIWFDKDGNPSISEEAEKLGMPYMVYGNTFNQGMWYSVKDSFKTLVSGTGMTQEMITKYGSGISGRIHAIMDNSVDSRNLKWLGCDLMRWLIQMMIAYFVFEAAKKALTGKRDASNYKEIAAKKSMLKFGEEVFVQSMGDFNYLDIANSSVLDISSSTFSVTTRIAKRMKNIVFDDDTKAFDLFLKDTGFGRMFNEFGEAYKYGKKLEEM